MSSDRATRFVMQHALFWLMVGNGVGLWLALLLIFPELNRLTGEVTYGRIVPVHLNIQLYGWTSLPLVAWLLHLYPSANERDEEFARGATLIWSATLLVATISWLLGRSSGKIFLEWRGFPRVLFCFNLLWLWTALLIRFLQLHCFRSMAQMARLGGLAVLGAVIPTWFWAAGPAVYPAVNPESGGPTAGSLLGSTLLVVFLLLIAGRLLGKSEGVVRARLCWIVFAVEVVVLSLFGGGNKSNRSLLQIALLAALLPWPALLLHYFGKFRFQENSFPWLKSTLGWFALLTFTGWISFLPKVLDGWKFTNALVAHSHLAMAGFVSCFNFFVLSSLGGTFGPRTRKVWNTSTLAYVVLMWIAGTIEAFDPGFIILRSPAHTLLYGGRAIVGAVMFVCSVIWWRSSMIPKTESMDANQTELEANSVLLAA